MNVNIDFIPVNDCIGIAAPLCNSFAWIIKISEPYKGVRCYNYNMCNMLLSATYAAWGIKMYVNDCTTHSQSFRDTLPIMFLKPRERNEK